MMAISSAPAPYGSDPARCLHAPWQVRWERDGGATIFAKGLPPSSCRLSEVEQSGMPVALVDARIPARQPHTPGISLARDGLWPAPRELSDVRALAGDAFVVSHPHAVSLVGWWGV